MNQEVMSTNERMIFSVQSERNPLKRYRVDLLANNGNGACSCTDHATRRQPYLNAGGDGFDLVGKCKHTAKARRYFLKMLLKDMAASEEQR